MLDTGAVGLESNLSTPLTLGLKEKLNFLEEQWFNAMGYDSSLLK
jgi:hypothetical protein